MQLRKNKRLISFGSGTLTALLIVGGMALAGNAAQQKTAEQHQRTLNEIQAQQTAEFNENLQCLALNIYHEARSESTLGKRAVAWVTLNRVQSKEFPGTICDVVYQAHLDASGNPKRHQCQFSWYCDGASDRIRNQEEWAHARQLAHQVITNFGRIPDPTDGATYYHAVYVNPHWASSFKRTTRIDQHIFYAAR